MGAPRIDRLETNWIRNGAIELSQRYVNNLPTKTSGDYLVDRFRYGKAGTMVQIGGRFEGPGKPSTFWLPSDTNFQSQYSVGLQVTTAQPVLAAGDNAQLYYAMEGTDYMGVWGRRCLLSFWVKATATGVYSVSFRNTAVSRTLIKNFTVNSTGVWEKKTMLVDLNDTMFAVGPGNLIQFFTNQVGLYIGWALAAGATHVTPTVDSWVNGSFLASTAAINSVATNLNKFQITEVMLVPLELAASPVTTVAPDLKFRRFMDGSISDEIEACQRYLCKSYPLDVPLGTASNHEGAILFQQYNVYLLGAEFPTRMRGNPIMLPWSPVTGASNVVRNVSTGSDIAGLIQQVGTSGFGGVSTSAASNNHTLTFHWHADADF